MAADILSKGILKDLVREPRVPHEHRSTPLQIHPSLTDVKEVEADEHGMVHDKSLCQDVGWSYSIRELLVRRSKLGEVPLKPELDHPSRLVEVGLKWSALDHLMEEMVEVSQDKRSRGNVIKRVQRLHQRDPLELHSFRLVWEHMHVQPIKKEVHMFLSPICNGRWWVEHFLTKWDEAREWHLIAFEGWGVVLQIDDGLGGPQAFSGRARRWRPIMGDVHAFARGPQAKDGPYLEP